MSRHLQLIEINSFLPPVDKYEGGCLQVVRPPRLQVVRPPSTSGTPPVYKWYALLYWIPCIGFPVWIKIPVPARVRNSCG